MRHGRLALGEIISKGKVIEKTDEGSDFFASLSGEGTGRMGARDSRMSDTYDNIISL